MIRALIRDALGRAHYERMRQGMSPTLTLPAWEALSDSQREPYRARFDYAIPALVAVVGQLGREDNTYQLTADEKWEALDRAEDLADRLRKHLAARA